MDPLGVFCDFEMICPAGWLLDANCLIVSSQKHQAFSSRPAGRLLNAQCSLVSNQQHQEAVWLDSSRLPMLGLRCTSVGIGYAGGAADHAGGDDGAGSDDDAGDGAGVGADHAGAGDAGDAAVDGLPMEVDVADVDAADVEFAADYVNDADPVGIWEALAEWEDVVDHPESLAHEHPQIPPDPVVHALGPLPTVETTDGGKTKIFRSIRTGKRIARQTTVRHEQPGECLCIVCDAHKCRIMKASRKFPGEIDVRQWLAVGEDLPEGKAGWAPHCAAWKW